MSLKVGRLPYPTKKRANAFGRRRCSPQPPRFTFVGSWISWKLSPNQGFRMRSCRSHVRYHDIVCRCRPARTARRRGDRRSHHTYIRGRSVQYGDFLGPRGSFSKMQGGAFQINWINPVKSSWYKLYRNSTWTTNLPTSMYRSLKNGCAQNFV